MALKITVLGIGRRDEPFGACTDELCRLIAPYAAVEVAHIRSPGRQDGGAEALAAEGTALRRRWPEGAYAVALSPEGRQLDTPAFAKWLGERRMEGRPVVFCIGGAYGLDQGLKRRCAALLSLSALTLGHRIALVVLLEQIYRGLTILAGHPYHK
jgi:23S rRNA (pseudouridine1915-N3)-methyltransferase